MMLQLKRWLTPPVFPDDEIKTRRAHLLNSILINIAALIPVIIIGNFLGGRTPLPVLGVDVLGLVSCLVLRAWLQRGQVRLASMALTIIGLVLVTTAVASLGTVRAPATAMYILVVIMGGLLFDLHGLVITTALCSLLLGGLIGAENAGLLPRPDFSVTITQWVAYTAIFGWTGSLAFAALQGMQQALVRADNEIGERKQTEQALRVLSERNEAILQTVPDIIAEVDLNKVYTWVNQAGQQFFGEEVIGKEAAFYFEGEQNTYEKVQPLFEGDPSIVYVESWQRRQDGERRLLAWWCRNLKDANGNVTGAISTARDITERKQAEETLEASDRLISLSTDLVCIAGMDGYFKYVNPAWEKVLGYSKEELLIKPFLTFIHPEDHHKNDEEVAKLGQGKLTIDFENRYICRDDSIRHMLWTATPDTERKLMYCIGRDITERKQAEAQLNEQLDELRRWHRATLGREMRILDLKREVNELLAQAGQPPCYPSAEDTTDSKGLQVTLSPIH